MRPFLRKAWSLQGDAFLYEWRFCGITFIEERYAMRFNAVMGETTVFRGIRIGTRRFGTFQRWRQWMDGRKPAVERAP